MTGTFVVRLLTDSGALLAWAEVRATAKVQDRAGSCPFVAPGPTLFGIEQKGTATRISVHWTDLDVARVQALMEPLDVDVGQVATFAWIEPVWLVPGMRDVPLPEVTVRGPVVIRPPAGSLAALAVR